MRIGARLVRRGATGCEVVFKSFLCLFLSVFRLWPVPVLIPGILPYRCRALLSIVDVLGRQGGPHPPVEGFPAEKVAARVVPHRTSLVGQPSKLRVRGIILLWKRVEFSERKG